jgi:hypothetical protein
VKSTSSASCNAIGILMRPTFDYQKVKNEKFNAHLLIDTFPLFGPIVL